MTLIVELLTILAPVFLTAAVGYVWGLRRWSFNHAFVAEIIGKVSAPCLVFAALASAAVDPAALGTVALAMALCVVVFFAVGWVGLRALGMPVSVHLPPLITPNTGNMGLPVSLFAFGPEGLAYGVAIMATLSITCFTLNIWIASGKASPLEAVRQPAVWAAALGMAAATTGVELPRWLFNTTELIGGIAIPLMLIALGVSIAELEIRHLGRSVGLSLWRIGMGLAVGVAMAAAFGLTGAAAGVLILQASMPAAVFTFLFAQMYDQRPAEVAGTIVVSTLLSLITLPLILWAVLPA